MASNEEERTRPVGVVVPSRRAHPRRRRRPALLGGAVLVAISPVAVGAGRFVAGYVALGVGASLLLLPPPRENRRRGLHSTRSILRRPVGAAGRGAVALARGGARLGARALRAVEGFATTRGRDGATAVGRTARATGSHARAATRAVGPIVWHGLVVATGSIAGEARSPSIVAWMRTRPMLRRAWSAGLIGLARARRELTPLARWGSERVAVYLDSRAGKDRAEARSPQAPRAPTANPAEPTRRGARSRSSRSPRAPRSSR